MHTRHLTFPGVVIALMFAPALALAQGVGVRVEAHGFAGGDGPQNVVFSSNSFEILDASPLEAGVIKNAPFSADAVTEFTQTLGDGNRIERSFKASLARDSQGRTRREEQVALLGPLAGSGEPPKLVTISDPVAGVHYTLDEKARVARRDRVMMAKLAAVRDKVGGIPKLDVFPKVEGLPPGWNKDATFETFAVTKPLENQAIAGTFFLNGPASKESAVVEKLGTQQIEGVEAEGTRTTTTIPAGAIGNVQPINVVTERWYSTDLQMAVLITRRDPRSGDTTYRLTNLLRAEPSEDLFTVPRDYRVEDLQDRLIEIEQLKKLRTNK